MSHFTQSVNPALFDRFTDEAEFSLQKEIERILISRNLSKELEGLCSDFGIPMFEGSIEGAVKEHLEKIEYTIAYYIMKFETRLEKTTVKVKGMRDGQILANIDLYPQINLIPISMNLTIQM